MAGLATMSSAQIVSASSLQNAGAHRMFGTPGIAGNAVPMHTMLSPSEYGVKCFNMYYSVCVLLILVLSYTPLYILYILHVHIVYTCIHVHMYMCEVTC